MPEQLYALARVHQAHQINLALRTKHTVEAVWHRYGGLDDTALQTFVRAVVPIMQLSIDTAVRLTDLNLAQYATMATSDTIEPIGLDSAAIVYRGGATLADVYSRPVIVARAAIAAGASFQDAFRLGGARAAQLADTDPMLAARAAADDIMTKLPRVVGYRRLVDGNGCDYCLIASTQRYHVGDLMPIHPGCHCTTVPIMGMKDPGRIIDKEAHARLKASGAIDEKSYERRLADAPDVVANYQAKADHWREQARITPDQEAETRYAKRADVWAQRAKDRQARIDDDRRHLDEIRARRAGNPSAIAVHEHGELGPTLYPAGVHFNAA